MKMQKFRKKMIVFAVVFFLGFFVFFSGCIRNLFYIRINIFVCHIAIYFGFGDFICPDDKTRVQTNRIEIIFHSFFCLYSICDSPLFGFLL